MSVDSFSRVGINLTLKMRIFMIAIFIVMYTIYVISKTLTINKNISKDQNKYILLWNSHVYFDRPLGEGREPFVKMRCPQTNCVVTRNRSRMNVEDFDAIVFHGFPFPLAKDLPAVRRPHQRYVLLLMESPQYKKSPSYELPYDRIKKFFNWTMTYIRTSDIPILYMSVVPKQISDEFYLDLFPTWSNIWNGTDSGAEEKQILQIIASKQKPVAWFVSNCKAASKRLDYVKELQKYIPVDIFGKCGNMSTQCSKTVSKCTDILESNYWFYLSFENSLCEDYVTEKLNHALQQVIVPIVYGGANYTFYIPPQSYLDVRDFKSPRELALRLRELTEQPLDYAQFFRWKRHYRLMTGYGNTRGAFCRLCEKLHSSSDHKVYDDMEEWWGEERRCHSPMEHPGMGWL